MEFTYKMLHRYLFVEVMGSGSIQVKDLSKENKYEN